MAISVHFQTVALSDGRVEGVRAGPASQLDGMLGSALIKNLSLDPSDHTSKRWWMDRHVCMRVCICWHSMCWNMERKPHITLLMHIFLSIHCPDSLIHIQTCTHNTHTYTHTLLSAQSSVSSPSWPIRRSGLWSLPLDLLGLFWQLVRNTKRWGGSKSRGRVKVYMYASVHACVCKIACVLWDSYFNSLTACCAPIMFKGLARTALFFSCLWISYCLVSLEQMH